MKVEVIKTGPSGKWAYKHIELIDIKLGVQEMSNSLADELIKAGWAKAYKETQEHSKAPAIKPNIESVEKGTSGWWVVNLSGNDKAVKVRGADKDEAIKNAMAKLEVP